MDGEETGPDMGQAYADEVYTKHLRESALPQPKRVDPSPPDPE
ncbi:MAG: hypothetical protein U1G05_11705 [Kiritimatiellia bacterium]